MNRNDLGNEQWVPGQGLSAYRPRYENRLAYYGIMWPFGAILLWLYVCKYARVLNRELHQEYPGCRRMEGAFVGMRMLVAILLLGPAAGIAAESGEVRHEVDAATGIGSWVLKAEEFSLELIQRLPDQTRAFFQGRGFDTVAANEIALGCVFQTVIKNVATESGAPVVAFDLSEWRIDVGQGQRPLKLEHDWQKDWERRGVDQAARIAFRWALYPTRQEFHPGDYNWGMTTYGVSPGSMFDLHVVWHRGDELRRHTIKGVRCAPDR